MSSLERKVHTDALHGNLQLQEESAETAYIEARDPQDNYVQPRDDILPTKHLLARPSTPIPPRFSWGLPSSEYSAA